MSQRTPHPTGDRLNATEPLNVVIVDDVQGGTGGHPATDGHEAKAASRPDHDVTVGHPKPKPHLY